jgi:hypothetical protein
MGRKYAQINIEKRVKEGRGQGHGKDYKPWLSVQSFSSLGYANRVPGWKTGREHHLMSNLELDFFYMLEWSCRVVDIREQYPLLPVEETVTIASALGIRHPTNPKTKQPIALTTDFLITARREPRNVDEARTIKPASELQSLRTMQKLEIERHYWGARNVDWGIVTDADISQNVVRNLRWLHPCFKFPATSALPESCPDKVDCMLREFLERGFGLAAGAQACDDKLGLEAGTSLTLARHFIASRRWKVDLNEKIDPALSLKILNSAVM